jgi:hypothetical protein
MGTDDVFEFAAWNVDGELTIRSSQHDDPHYPAASWARDQRALGARVQRRRIRILDDWSDLPASAESAL